MTSVANSSSRSRNGGAAALDDLDAGWEDPPESASVPLQPTSSATSTPAPSLVPVATAPRPRSSVHALAGPRSPVAVVIEVSEEASAPPFEDECEVLSEAESAEAESAEAESVADVRDDELMDTSASADADGRAAPSATEVELPGFRRRQPSRVTFAVSLASAALIMAGIAWSQRASSGEPVTAGAAAPVSEPRAPEGVPEPERAEPVPPATAPATSEVASAPVPAAGVAVGASPQKESTAVAVTVKVVPAGAVVFRAGRRLGAGLVEVSVERNVRQRLTALHDGYAPANFTLDGSRDSVTIVLRRAPKPRAEPAQPSAPLAAEPTADSSAATAPAPTLAAAPESAPQAAPEPAASVTEPSPE